MNILCKETGYRERGVKQRIGREKIKTGDIKIVLSDSRTEIFRSWLLLVLPADGIQDG